MHPSPRGRRRQGQKSSREVRSALLSSSTRPIVNISSFPQLRLHQRRHPRRPHHCLSQPLAHDLTPRLQALRPTTLQPQSEPHLIHAQPQPSAAKNRRHIHFPRPPRLGPRHPTPPRSTPLVIRPFRIPLPQKRKPRSP